jgi:hypothetical protein
MTAPAVLLDVLEEIVAGVVDPAAPQTDRSGALSGPSRVG